MDIRSGEGALSNVPVYFSYEQSDDSYPEVEVSSVPGKNIERKLEVSIPLNPIKLSSRTAKPIADSLKTEQQCSSLLMKLAINESDVELMDLEDLIKLSRTKCLSEDELEELKKYRGRLKNKSAQSSVRERQKLLDIQLRQEISDLKYTVGLLGKREKELENEIKEWKKKCRELSGEIAT